MIWNIERETNLSDKLTQRPERDSVQGWQTQVQRDSTQEFGCVNLGQAYRKKVTVSITTVRFQADYYMPVWSRRVQLRRVHLSDA